MTGLRSPSLELNCIEGRETLALGGECFPKYAPATGQVLAQVAGSRAADVRAAVAEWNSAWPLGKKDLP
jgi:acyl-CoA reductase-like NAD-dependent aldehyde dehydrogenase